MKRESSIERTTTETDISIRLDLDGTGVVNVETGIGFLDHMLILFASHGQFDMDIKCVGDISVDAHHTAEDIGIVLGKAFNEALGDKKGINRYGTFTLPMDESLAMVNVDLSGRPYLHYNIGELPLSLGSMDSQSFEELFRGFVNHSRATIHINLLYGRNGHHIMESIFKALGRALDEAVSYRYGDSRIPSTKGILD